jgi:hypothetical protein
MSEQDYKVVAGEEINGNKNLIGESDHSHDDEKISEALISGLRLEPFKGATSDGTISKSFQKEGDMKEHLLLENQFNITDGQKLPETRFSSRIQAQLEKKQAPSQPPTKKRNLEGTNLSDQNSFAVLGNDDIMNLAIGMGVVISPDQFDKVDILKDIELARHALQNVKNVKIPDIEMEPEQPTMVNSSDVPLLEWLEDDSGHEQFTLVQTRRKKKETCENSTGTFSWGVSY